MKAGVVRGGATDSDDREVAPGLTVRDEIVKCRNEFDLGQVAGDAKNN